METVQPAKGMIFAKQVEAEKQTASGLFLVDSAVENLSRAAVINTGVGVSEYQRDDIIIYREYSATPTKVNGEEFILLAEEDVLGKVIKTEG